MLTRVVKNSTLGHHQRQSDFILITHQLLSVTCSDLINSLLLRGAIQSGQCRFLYLLDDCFSVRCSDLNSSLCSQVLTRVLKHGSPGLQLRGTDVMLSAIQHDPAPLRQFMRSQKDHELFHLLVRYFCICQTCSF